MNWLLVMVGIVLLIGIINGYVKGAIRILVSLVTTVVTIVVVFFSAPYVSQAMFALTPLDEVIESACRSSIEKMGEASSEVWKEYQLDSDRLSDGESLELPRNLQIHLIENADYPEVFKELLISNNNSEVYEMLGVTSFVDYVAKYMTKLIVDIVSFLLTFIIVTIVIRAIVFALDFVSALPLLGILNRLSGAVIGGVLSLIIVWFAFVVITLLYETSIGEVMLKMIGDDAWLTLLYNMNPILKIMTMLR